MNNQQEIKLSSNWTNIGLYGGGLLALTMIPVLFLVTKEQKFHMGMVLAGTILLAVIGLMIYLFIYTCDARVREDQIHLKKQFRQSKSYSFDKIGRIKSFQLQTTKYILVEMENDDHTLEKYIIMNSSSIISFESKDAEATLISLRNSAIKK